MLDFLYSASDITQEMIISP